MKRLTDYESFNENPFTLEHDLEFFKKVILRNGEVVDSLSGEVLDTSWKWDEWDNKPFIKMFTQALPVFQGLKPKAHRVLYDILIELRPGEDEVYLNATLLASKHGLSNSRDILLGIKELIDHDIICRKAEKDVYFVNVRLVFNGSRVKYQINRKK